MGFREADGFDCEPVLRFHEGCLPILSAGRWFLQVVSEEKRDGCWLKRAESAAANRLLWVFLFAFRVSFSVLIGAGLKTLTRGLQAGPWGASQVASVL